MTAMRHVQMQICMHMLMQGRGTGTNGEVMGLPQHLVGDDDSQLVLVCQALQLARQPEQARRALRIPVPALACRN
jgi:hypothetical protein